MLTQLKIALRDTLYYKALPFALRLLEVFEAPVYAGQKRHVRAPQAAPRNAFLFLTYGRGGGADKHVEDVACALEAAGGEAWLLHFHPLQRIFTLARGKIHDANARRFTFPSQYAAMVSHLQSLGLRKLHIHHTRYLPYRLLQDLPEFAASLGVPYDYMMHDFIAICPREHLIDRKFHYCGMPDDARVCNTCVARNGFLTTAPGDVGEWRAVHRELFKKAEALFAPSADTAERHKRILGDVNITVLPHDATLIVSKHFPAKAAGEAYVVAVVGRIHRHKGADVLLACARDAATRKLPLQFAVIGDSVYESELKDAGVSLTGVYREEELQKMLAQSRCSLVFLPSVWPETYSYVLSHIWAGGYFPVAFDMGAPAERIRAAGNGMTLPLSMIDSPSAINDALLKAAHEQHSS